MKRRFIAKEIKVEKHPLRFGYSTPSGELIFTGFERPSQAHYEKLILQIAVQTAKIQEGGNRLLAVEEALGAVISFLQSDNAVVFFGLATPLTSLFSAVHDTRLGGHPDLLRVEDGAQNRPAGETFNAIRGQISAALASLLLAGLKISDAAIEVEQRLKDLQITQPNGHSISAKLLKRWRENLNQNKADRLMTESFLRISSQSKDQLGQSPSKEEALRWCTALLRSLIPWTEPPQKPPSRRK